MIKPIADRIVVKQKIQRKEEAKKVGSIYIPETAEASAGIGKALDSGEVVAVGYGTRLHTGEVIPGIFKIGQTVYWQKNYSPLIPLENYNAGDEDHNYYLTKESEIVAVE